MDSVVVFFGNASFDDVEREAVTFGLCEGTVFRGSEKFHLWRYSAEQMQAECDVEELSAVQLALGSEIKSAFQVACRHGVDAQLAVQVVGGLMSRLSPAVLDDDFGGLWLPTQVAAFAEAESGEGIYGLRQDA